MSESKTTNPLGCLVLPTVAALTNLAISVLFFNPTTLQDVGVALAAGFLFGVVSVVGVLVLAAVLR